MVSDKLKQFIFKRLYKELGNAEIIPHKNSIWFINREEKYWYFEFEGNDTLWWRYDFFPSFFSMFSLERADFEQILASWVEEVLNHKVKTTNRQEFQDQWQVEEVLNHKVKTTISTGEGILKKVEEVLNHKVKTTSTSVIYGHSKVEEVLNHKVKTTMIGFPNPCIKVEEVLNHKVKTTKSDTIEWKHMVEEVLNHKVETTKKYHDMQPWYLEKVLKNTEQNESNG